MAPIRNAVSTFAIGLFAVACGSDPKPPPETPVTADNTPEVTADAKQSAADETSNETVSDVRIDDRVSKMCELPEARFDFDSAQVSLQARSVLDKLARCFIDGPGKDKNLHVVGHADPRGETEYNFALGQRRAGSVAGYLHRAGLGSSRVASSSQGELHATGTDEAGWARDRRVEILLAD